MILKRWAAIAPFLLATTLASPALAAEKISFGVVADPSYDVALYALTSGKISDPNLEFKIDAMPFPRLAQATMTRQFNVTLNGVLGVPLMIEAGIPVKVMGTSYRHRVGGHVSDLWVMKDSPYQKMSDLKGKKIATASLESQATVSTRQIIGERYNMNAATIGGDVRWVELPNPQIEPALQSGNVDAALITNVQAYTAANSGQYRSILHGSAELADMLGGPLPTVLLIAYTDDLEKRPDVYAAFGKLLKDSSDYANAHLDEVAAAIAPKYKMTPGDLKTWFQTYGSIPFALSSTDKAVIVKAWESGAKLGALKTVPKNADDIIWSRAQKE